MNPISADVVVRFTYHVHFTYDLFSPLNNLLLRVVNEQNTTDSSPNTSNKRSRVLFVVDECVEQVLGIAERIEAYCAAHTDAIELVATPLLVPGGERIKNEYEHVEAVQTLVNDTGLDRHSYIVAIGGGALLDAVGYAAATAHRGIRLIRVPTTTLSQDDSGVGVKNAVNAFGKKNFIGAFAPPFAVLNDFKFLETLPPREWRGGMSEAVKVALLKDAEFFAFLEENGPALHDRDMDAMRHLVRRCAELHVQHICTSGDAFEMGSSRPLDFGHWAAHKLEQITEYRLSHGDAVAIGLGLDCTYSHLKGWLTQDEWERILGTLSSFGFELWSSHLTNHLDESNHQDNVFRGLREFREHLGGELTIAMLQGIGHGFDVHEIDEDVMLSAMHMLEEQAGRLAQRPRGRQLEALEAAA